MVPAVAPPIHLIAAVKKNVRRHAKTDEDGPKSFHLLPSTPGRTEGLRFHDHEIDIRIVPDLASSPRAKQDDLFRINLTDDRRHHVFQPLFGDRDHNRYAFAPAPNRHLF